jgi:hypothetical protein
MEQGTEAPRMSLKRVGTGKGRGVVKRVEEEKKGQRWEREREKGGVEREREREREREARETVS